MARVLLRPPRAGDREEWIALVRESRRLHHPWVSPPADARRFAEWLARTRRPDFRSFLVCQRTDGAIVGCVNLSQIFYGGFRSAYLGYWVGAPYARQGYMREGMRLVLRAAFAGLRLHRLEANIQPENQASIALVRGSGFRKEGFSPRYLKIGGRWRDHERWAITVEDWRRR